MKSKARLLVFLSVFSLAIAACAGVGGEVGDASSLTESITFQSIESIIDGELEVTNFANDGSATLPIHTSVPVACSVVYGETPEFGMLTLDQDMAGGTHSDHNPLLLGLDPETTYYFRAQGVDDNGVVYLSEMMTFTTPPLAARSETRNLASPKLGAEIVGYSSAFGGAGLTDRWGPGSAFDDNPNTEWSSAGDGNEAWVEVSLAQRAQIESVVFQTRSMSDGSAIAKAFTVTTDSGQVHGPFELPDANEAYTFELPIEAKTLRFDLVDTTGGNTGVVDIAVYGQFIGE